MNKLFSIIIILVVVSAILPVSSQAAGISVDTGLTPAEDRWILRTQLRYMQRDDDPTSMDRKIDKYTLNTVLAYGLRRNLTLMLKQPAVHKETSTAGTTSKDTGLADLSLIVKYGIYRRNTREYTFGIATTLGFEFPTGADAFTSETWDVKPGLYTSWRSGPWATDFNVAYAWNGFADENNGGINPGDELSLDWALAYQFSIGEKAKVSLAPVLELSYKNIWPDRLRGDNVSNTGDSVFYLSPGIKFTKSSFILEALLQIPVWQDQEGSQLKRGIGSLVGTRFMF